MSSHDQEILAASEELMQRLRPGDLDATLRDITRAAVDMLAQVDYSSLTMRHADGSLDSCAVTDDRLLDLDRQQYELQEGPCYDATTDVNFISSGDLTADDRYPRYGAMAARVGIRSQAGIRLFESRRTVGGLNLYSGQVGAFESLDTVGRLFSHQAAVALAYSLEIANLQEALQTRTRIGQAVGIVMERYAVAEQQAFAFLTRLSQTRNVKLRLLADELVAVSDKAAGGS